MCHCPDKLIFDSTITPRFYSRRSQKKNRTMKRSKKIEFRTTHTEYLIIQNKALKSGTSISEFLRNTAMGYPLSYKLTEDEIAVYKQLNQYADHFRRIGNLFKLGDTTGVKEACVETTKLIRNHLNKLK